VTDILVRNTSHAAVHAAANGFALSAIQAATPVHVATLVRGATAALAWGRLKVAVGTALLIASSLAGAGEVLRRYDVLQPSLHTLNPMNWMRPIFERLFTAPRLQVELTPAGDDQFARGLQTADPFSFVPPATTVGLPEPLNFADQFTLHMSGQSVLVESQRTMASQLKLAFDPFVAPIAQAAVVPVVPKLVNLSLSPSPTASLAATASTSTPTVSANLIIDRALNGGASIALVSEGLYRVSNLVVGDSTVGHLVQDGGKVHVNQSLVIAKNAGSSGTYTMNGGELFAANMTVGAEGDGNFVQNSGEVVITGAASGDPARASQPGVLTIADKAGSTGEYVLNDGRLYADVIHIGNEGKGSLTQNGGTASFQIAKLGGGLPGDGTWTLTDGRIEVAANTVQPGETPQIVVGEKGWGTFVVRSDLRDPFLSELPGAENTTIVIRSEVDGQGVFRGFGKVDVSGVLVQNGKVIADGSGKPRTLHFPSVSGVVNSIENPADGGTNGWFARNRGTLVLPALPVTDGSTLTWGEDPNDPVIDLVNSVRLVPRNVRQPGSIQISLLDPQSPEAPALPDGIKPLSLWSLESTADFDGIDLMIRYDDVQAAFSGIAESDLALWVYEGAWRPVIGESFSRDTLNHLLSGSVTNPTYFAAAPIPEPATLTVGALLAGTLLLRRRTR
jgi:hypothetical protein